MSALPRCAVRVFVAGAAVVVAVAALRARRRYRRAWAAAGHPRQGMATAFTVLPGPPVEVYDLLHDVPRVAAAIGYPGVAPAVQLTGDLPGVLLSWRVAEAPLPHEGTARLHAVAGADRTEVAVQLRYRWSPDLARAARVPEPEVHRRLDECLRALHRSAAGTA
jgi:hypothetical protein